MLEAGCQRRTVSAPMRLRAAALYGLLGAPGPAASTFRELAVKHIQHDTVTGEVLQWQNCKFSGRESRNSHVC